MCVCINSGGRGCKSVNYKLNKEVGRGEKMPRKGDNNTSVTCRRGVKGHREGGGRNVGKSMRRRIQLYVSLCVLVTSFS